MTFFSRKNANFKFWHFFVKSLAHFCSCHKRLTITEFNAFLNLYYCKLDKDVEDTIVREFNFLIRSVKTKFKLLLIGN